MKTNYLYSEIIWLGISVTVKYDKDDGEIEAVSCEDCDDFFDMLNDEYQQKLINYFDECFK